MRLLSILILSAFFGTVAAGHREKTPATNEGPQDSVYLDRRITMLETRFNTIESSLRNLEQQALSAQRSAIGQPSHDPEISILRSEVEILKARMRELECGLVHIDERTLSVTAREGRKKAAGQFVDPCRTAPETPVELSTHR